jgi:mono/diheme cytochrome c family protein
MLRKTASVVFLIVILVVATPAFAADGAAIFKSKCAPCHSADGSGDSAMGKKLGVRSLASPEVQKQTDAELTATISKGKNKMPAYAGKIDDASIAAVVSYLRTLAKK